MKRSAGGPRAHPRPDDGPHSGARVRGAQDPVGHTPEPSRSRSRDPLFPGPRRRGLALGCGALAIFTVVVFQDLLSHRFVNYDDGEYVTQNSHVQRGLTADSIRWAFTTTHAANWHPLTWLSHMLDVQLFGLDPGKHHGTNLLLHVLDVLLLFLVFVRMTGAFWRSGFVAALFAVHPLHVESVAWIAERKDVLSTLFWLLTLAAWLRYLDARTPWRYALVLFLYACGLMAKPMLVTLPFTLLLLDFWPLGRWTQPRARRFSRIHEPAEPALRMQQTSPDWQPTAAVRPATTELLLEKTPLFAMAAASCAITLFAQARGGAVQALGDLPLSMRIANAVVAYAAYLGKMLWPAPLSVFYPYPDLGVFSWQVAAAGLVLAAITILALRLRRRAPYVLFGWLWYLGTLLPVIGLVQVGSQAMADRYTYVPLLGPFVAIAWGLSALFVPGRRLLAACASIVFVLVLGHLSRVQAGYWKDDASLYGHALAVTSGNWLAHAYLGRTLFEDGRTEEAIAQITEALRISPEDSEARNDLGIALARQGRFDEAIEQYRQALQRSPGFALVRNNLGIALVRTGRIDEAIEQYESALRSDPGLAEAHCGLGVALVRRGRIDEAIAQYGEALRLRPDFAEAQDDLGLALDRLGRHAEALDQFEQAVRSSPKSPSAHLHLGNALVVGGRIEPAIAQYERALQLRPDSVEALNNLGLALTRSNRFSDAILRFERALQIDPTSAELHNNLGYALVQMDRLPQAAERFQQALRLNPEFSDARANLRRVEEALGEHRLGAH